jgi:hypothetical protein
LNRLKAALLSGALCVTALFATPAAMAANVVPTHPASQSIANFRYVHTRYSNRSLWIAGSVKATYNPHYIQYGVRVECLQFNRVAGGNRFYWANGIVQTGVGHLSKKTCVRGSRQYVELWQGQIRLSTGGPWRYSIWYKHP